MLRKAIPTSETTAARPKNIYFVFALPLSRPPPGFSEQAVPRSGYLAPTFKEAIVSDVRVPRFCPKRWSWTLVAVSSTIPTQCLRLQPLVGGEGMLVFGRGARLTQPVRFGTPPIRTAPMV